MKISCFYLDICYNLIEKGITMIKNCNIKLYHNDKLIENNIINIIENNNKISFLLNDIKNIIDKNTFIRENNEYRFILNIEDKECSYLLKEKNTLYDIKVNKSSIKQKDNIIEILYNIETNDEDIKLIIERCE